MARQRRNQAILDFIEDLKKKLGDNRPKSFSIYVKMYRNFGKQKLAWAAEETLKRNPTDKFRYFLGILWNIKENKTVLTEYKKMRSVLVKQMTPPTLRSAKKRSGVQVRLSHRERRARG